MPDLGEQCMSLSNYLSIISERWTHHQTRDDSTPDVPAHGVSVGCADEGRKDQTKAKCQGNIMLVLEPHN